MLAWLGSRAGNRNGLVAVRDYSSVLGVERHRNPVLELDRDPRANVGQALGRIRIQILSRELNEREGELLCFLGRKWLLLFSLSLQELAEQVAEEIRIRSGVYLEPTEAAVVDDGLLYGL